MKTGYKATRTTIVLALHSRYLKSIQDNRVLAALSNVVGANYDLSRVADDDLESIYAHFTDEVAAKVRDEYVFTPTIGNVRDNKAPVASCSLCGKGDSRDDGANADHIRYEFRLTNTSGGEDVWCGSTCIINHALRVAGAATGADAKKLLEKSFREHLKAWQREEWREQNPDHTDIYALYERGRFLRTDKYRGVQEDLADFGYTYEVLYAMRRKIYNWRGTGEFANAVRFYQRSEWLTPKKEVPWREAKQFDAIITAIDRALVEAQRITDREARRAFFTAAGEKFRNPLGSVTVLEPEAKSA